MAFVAVFEVRLGDERGVAIAEDQAAALKPIELMTNHLPVCVTPVVISHTEEDYVGPDGEPLKYEVEYLDVLRAEVTIESEEATLEVGRKDTDRFFGNPRRAAVAAFRRILSHLRSVTGTCP